MHVWQVTLPPGGLLFMVILGPPSRDVLTGRRGTNRRADMLTLNLTEAAVDTSLLGFGLLMFLSFLGVVVRASR